jgi:hypothetical protein
MSDETERRMEHMVANLGPRKAVDMIARAIRHIDVSRTARKYGDLRSAEGALTAARDLLLGVLGIPTEEASP